MMTVDSLEKYLKTLEEDYATVISETDMTIQELKKERHDLKIQARYKSKEQEVDKMEVKNLKTNLKSCQQMNQEMNTLMKKSEDENAKLKNELLTTKNDKAESNRQVKECR